LKVILEKILDKTLEYNRFIYSNNRDYYNILGNRITESFRIRYMIYNFNKYCRIEGLSFAGYILIKNCSEILLLIDIFGLNRNIYL